MPIWPGESLLNPVESEGEAPPPRDGCQAGTEQNNNSLCPSIFPCLSGMSVLHVCCMTVLHVHAACSCPCHMLMSMPHVQSMLHVHVHAACPFAFGMSLSILHVLASRLCCTSMLHVHAACPCRMHMLHEYDARICCINIMFEHVRWTLTKSDHNNEKERKKENELGHEHGHGHRHDPGMYRFDFFSSFRFVSFSFRILNMLFRFEEKQAKHTPLIRISLQLRFNWRNGAPSLQPSN
jgi:hypothetical protein